MKEYTIIGRQVSFEENFASKKELTNYLKDNNIKKTEISQIFCKTYNSDLEELDCTLLFCQFQDINKLNLK